MEIPRRATPAEVGAKYIRWGLRLFVFGLVFGFVPLAHYMHGSFELVGEAFLKNVTLWWGCAFALAVYVAQLGSLAMIAIGLCYVVLARDGAMTSVTNAERMAPALCVGGILAEAVAGVAGYYAVVAVWPNFYYAPVEAGKNIGLARPASRLHRHLRPGVIYAYGGIKRAAGQQRERRSSLAADGQLMDRREDARGVQLQPRFCGCWSSCRDAGGLCGASWLIPMPSLPTGISQ